MCLESEHNPDTSVVRKGHLSDADEADCKHDLESSRLIEQIERAASKSSVKRPDNRGHRRSNARICDLRQDNLASGLRIVGGIYVSLR